MASRARSNSFRLICAVRKRSPPHSRAPTPQSNLVGILTESDDQKFTDIQSRGARAVAEAVNEAGITRFVHISAIGARKNSPSGYARSKAEGEAAVHELVPQAIIFRPSIVFGPEDDFFNRFAAMARLMPILPLVGASTRFQPVFVDDIAQAIALALDGKATPGATYELGGPEVKTFRELVQYVCDVTRRRRYIVSLWLRDREAHGERHANRG